MAKKLCAYCFLKRNYLARYAFMAQNDYIINPYFTAPEMRGKGLAKRILKVAVNQVPYSDVWAVVKSENIPSIRALEATGFVHVGYSHQRKWSHRLGTSKSDLLVFCHRAD